MAGTKPAMNDGRIEPQQGLSPRQRPAVAAWIGAGDQHAGRRITADYFDAAGALEVAHRVHRMTAACEFAARRVGKAALDGQSVLAVMRVVGVLAWNIRGPARHLGRLLRIEVE